VAEVESRFQETTIDDFVLSASKFGFQLKWKDTSKDFFVLMDFKKVGQAKKKTPDLSLKPCYYKKR